jgi:hypothetical protein
MNRRNIFIVIILLLLSISGSSVAQNIDKWESAQDQYGNALIRFKSNSVSMAELDGGKELKFKDVPMVAMVVLDKYSNMTIRFTKKNGEIVPLSGYSIHLIKVFADQLEIYSENDAVITMNNIVVQEKFSATKRLVGSLLESKGMIDNFIYYVVLNNPNASRIAVEFSTKPVPR